MNRQVVTFATETKEGVVSRVGRSYVMTPEIRFQGGTIKWYPDKYKENKRGNSNV